MNQLPKCKSQNYFLKALRKIGINLHDFLSYYIKSTSDRRGKKDTLNFIKIKILYYPELEMATTMVQMFVSPCPEFTCWSHNPQGDGLGKWVPLGQD